MKSPHATRVLLSKHFPASHRLSKIINKNTIKLSYSSMPNMANIIKSINNAVLDPKPDKKAKLCNCRNASQCPLYGECLEESLVYEATLSTVSERRPYLGIAETTFKTRYGNHKKSFNHDRYKAETELSKKVWECKEKKIDTNEKLQSDNVFFHVKQGF